MTGGCANIRRAAGGWALAPLIFDRDGRGTLSCDILFCLTGFTFTRFTFTFTRFTFTFTRFTFTFTFTFTRFTFTFTFSRFTFTFTFSRFTFCCDGPVCTHASTAGKFTIRSVLHGKATQRIC
jgi:hypothetical protein